MGGFTTRDHIPTFYLRALSPPPHFPIRFILFLYLRIYRFKSAISIFPSLFTFVPHWRHPWFSHPIEFHAFLRPPIPLPTLQWFPPLHWDLNTRLKQSSHLSKAFIHVGQWKVWYVHIIIVHMNSTLQNKVYMSQNYKITWLTIQDNKCNVQPCPPCTSKQKPWRWCLHE